MRTPMSVVVTEAEIEQEIEAGDQESTGQTEDQRNPPLEAEQAETG